MFRLDLFRTISCCHFLIIFCDTATSGETLYGDLIKNDSITLKKEHVKTPCPLGENSENAKQSDWNEGLYGDQSETMLSSDSSYGSRVKRSSGDVDGNQCSMSLCPWRDLLDEDHNRTPVLIRYAECLSTDCSFNFSGVSNYSQNVLQTYTTCDLVKTDIRVIENGTVKYITDWPIACICTQITSHGTTPELPDKTREQIDLRHKYRRQQSERENIESFEELMARRKKEKMEKDMMMEMRRKDMTGWCRRNNEGPASTKIQGVTSSRRRPEDGSPDESHFSKMSEYFQDGVELDNRYQLREKGCAWNAKSNTYNS